MAKHKHRSKLVAGLVFLLLSGCVTSYQTTDSSRAPVLVEDRTLPSQEQSSETVEDIVVDIETSSDSVNPLIDEPSINIEPLVPEKLESAVIESLLASADQQNSTGDYDAAANSLERALRIEPRNATLWSRLAEIRYDQQEWQQAIQLAAKSNVMSGDNKHLRRRNWYLMANGYEALGDLDSAQKYREKVTATAP